MKNKGKDIYELIEAIQSGKISPIKISGGRITGKREARELHQEGYENELKELEQKKGKLGK